MHNSKKEINKKKIDKKQIISLLSEQQKSNSYEQYVRQNQKLYIQAKRKNHDYQRKNIQYRHYQQKQKNIYLQKKQKQKYFTDQNNNNLIVIQQNDNVVKNHKYKCNISIDQNPLIYSEKSKLNFCIYNIKNIERSLLTGQINMLNKLKKLENENQLLKDYKQSNLQKEQQNEDKIIYQKQSLRYFKNNQELGNNNFLETKICRRCKKPGHIAKFCSEQFVIRCHFCMCRHQKYMCPDSSICFRCGINGHVSKQCKLNKASCYKCKKVGHKQKQCSSLIFSDNQINNLLYQVICINCKKKGHVNCNIHQKDNVYDNLLQAKIKNKIYKRNTEKYRHSSQSDSINLHIVQNYNEEKSYTKKKLKPKY